MQNNTEPVFGNNKTDRSLWKGIVFDLLTCGIFNIIEMSQITDEVNLVASKYDGKKTMNYCLMFFVLGPVTCNIYTFIWHHQLAERIGDELKRRGIDYDFGVTDYWLWNVLGSSFLVGPFIYLHKLYKAMNLLNEDYNYYG